MGHFEESLTDRYLIVPLCLLTSFLSRFSPEASREEMCAQFPCSDWNLFSFFGQKAVYLEDVRVTPVDIQILIYSLTGCLETSLSPSELMRFSE